MRLYGGEISAHHYFKDFAYCDSGMVPWPYLAAFPKDKRYRFDNEKKNFFPSSGELNFMVADAENVCR